ncbi:lignostilbene-alpha,beta-dioxygenase-like protein [Mycolicibacterium phlei]|uniref:carotenoid oxygenase family protein n=1 Tax=Mycolicibacterium phlei TaxID=1771 RepID=UPI0007771247|nr:carotenoid oxygenase family protein [Mycolicibacterium phlei]AMO59695.1 Lignostilbene-alpha,beta-dioxygenase isozyme III [Mycolicibacterium phlei]KXW78353.1 apocarotenoid-15,15'-oxygenase [Mycolicibacterium phlei DSM 43071]STZ16266.1 lignostilbene-alpha,beta-dioxygenase-like protein [Mycolicibacterium phlei]VEG07823.1 lignostilbene-alpha,beta-dioxygenase-like protein [Mycobacteroides chelonae]
MGTANVEVVGKFLSTLPDDDDHPYRTGPWRPQNTEYDADDLQVIEGEIPADLDGVYLRNTENPLHPALAFYHPFDGDGMIHAVGFRDGKAFYRNRFVRTDGFLEEQEAGGALWPGCAEPVQLAKRDYGWGARTLMKDASSTDVVVHRGTALTSFWQCGDLYRLNPYTAETLGKEDFNGGFPSDWGVSAHPKVDEHTGELLYFSYSKQAPYMRWGVVDENNDVVHTADVELPGPRLPHDMAFTENYVIFNDFPMFWDPKLLEADIHLPTFRPELPSRFAVVPRRGGAGDVKWFEAAPTYVLHFTNAYEDGDEIVLDGFFEDDPTPTDSDADDKYMKLFRFLALDRLQTRLHRWRFNLKTGETREERLSDSISEFGMVNGAHGGRDYRYVWAATGHPGWFLFNGLIRHDLKTGAEERYPLGDGVYGSETAMAPRVGSTGEDDGYVVTIATDMNADASYALVFDAARIADGPMCKLALPERVSSGTHSTWVAGSELRRWRTEDSAAAAIGL